MARLMTIAYDAYYGTDAFPSYEYDWAGASADILQETVNQRTGGACVKIDSAAANGTGYLTTSWGLLGENGYYKRNYLRFSALPTSTVRVMTMETASVPLVGARLTAAGKLQLWNETGTPAQIGSDSAATIAVNTWYRIELHCKTVTGASDTAGLRLDGTEVASATGLALSDVNTYQSKTGWLDPPGASKTVLIDDGAVNNDLDTQQNSYPGEGKVAYLYPTADSAIGANWVAGAGGTSNLWDALNATTPGGVAAGSATNTSQIKCTSGTSQDYDATLQTYTAAGVEGIVNVLQARVAWGPAGATGRTDAHKLVSNPAVTEETMSVGAAAVGSFGTNWVTKWGAAQYTPSVTLGTAPVMRVSRRDAAATDMHVCSMSIAVDYTPSATSSYFTLLGIS